MTSINAEVAASDIFRASARPADEERVVLLEDDGTPRGTELKSVVHTEDTPLHLAFSVHLMAADGRVLMTRRALSKKTWPGVWTNSLCGHPAPGESTADAIRRRAQQELNLDPAWLSDPEPLLREFRYRAVDASGVVENEICPVFVVQLLVAPEQLPEPNPDEVAEQRWLPGADLVAAAQAAPFVVSPWLALHIEDERARTALSAGADG